MMLCGPGLRVQRVHESCEKLLKSTRMQTDIVVEPLWKFGSERGFFE